MNNRIGPTVQLVWNVAISVTRKNPQMSIKLPKNDFTRKIKILTPLQKLPKNVGDLGELIVTKVQ